METVRAKGPGQGWLVEGGLPPPLAEARRPACVTPVMVSQGFQGLGAEGEMGWV